MISLALQKRTVWIAGLFAVLVASRIPFFFTHHVQEDAYISLRCAVNLASTGVYGFNANERVSASTSHAYVLLAAAIRFVAGESFLPVVLVLNTIMLVAGTYLISGALFRDRQDGAMLWVLLTLTPTAMMISYSGMETSLLVLVIGLALMGFRGKRGDVCCHFAMALLPWVRPDSVAIGGILLIALSIAEKRVSLTRVLSLFVGVLSMLACNRLYFGSFLHQTIVAKLMSYHPSRSLQSMARNVAYVFWDNGTGGVFTPLATKFVSRCGILFFVLTVAALCVYLWRIRHRSESLVQAIAVAALALVVPAAYALGGVLFPWYLWPSSLFGHVIVIAALPELSVLLRRSRQTSTFVVAFVLVLVLDTGQLALSYNWGSQERKYRGGIGEYIKSISEPSDTIMLEPAGYIPFYSQRYTYDEIGLVSPQVTEYKERYGTRWWVRFVQDKRPDYLVQRSGILRYRTRDGYELTEAERAWFDESYVLVREFEYRPKEFARNTILLGILEMGSAVNYYLYELGN